MPTFETPPWTKNHRGEARNVGLELEMAGIEPKAIAETVISTVGGHVERESGFYSKVVDTELGDFGIELDADLLTSRKYQQQLSELGIDIGEGERRENIESILSRVAGLLVPLELVGPPVPWTELPTLDQIRRKLHQAGARGTHSSAFYAFGLQLNIEAASLEADHLLSMLRAFLLKFDWLLERNKIDLARRLSPYIQDFPEDFVIHVLQDNYRPDQAQLIDDFLTYTPTRNRPLDLLPLFAFLDSERVLKAPVEKALIKPRPAFHYRLPNCLIDEPDWSLALSWNDWVAVERLAADTDAITRECHRRLAGSSLFKWLVSGTMRWIRS